ncbi:MAG: hypothetical protein K6U03_11085, partial [Firmicutes bacterium]|nr:hypothetical protein [Bacillota bacterium]
MKTASSFLGPLLLLILLAGCVPAPRKGDGRLSLRVVWGGGRPGPRAVEEIRTVTASLGRQGLRITAALEVDQAGGTAAGRFEGLYPGDWNVKVDAAAADGTVIYTGQTTVTIISNEECSLAMTLSPNPGKLDFRMDIAPLLAGGLEITGGRLYVYGDPASNSATVTKDLIREGNLLRGLVENLPTKTYEARVAIPNLSNAVFISAYFSFSILPGRTTAVFLSADGGVDLIIGITAEPPQVTGLTAVVEEGRVVLSWQAVEEATRYRVYRTDADGRFRELALIDATTIGYVDEGFAQATPYAGSV